MRSILWSWIVCAAWMATSAQAGEVGDYRALPKDLAAAATAYDLAQFKSDRAELERLLADDYAVVDADGKTHTKADSIADATAPGSKTLAVDLTQPVTRVWRDGAVLGGMVDAKGLNRGKESTIHARFVDVWAKRKGHWQVVFTQVTKAD